MKLTPLERRTMRRARNQPLVDMNLVSLIDIFTILIFFLLSNTSEVQALPSSKAVKLPESFADKSPKETVVVVVNADEILVQGHKVASVAEAMATDADLIEPLKAELDIQASHELIRRENAPQNQPITIMGDKNIPYRLLRKVMYTCARANFSEVSFAVQRKNGA
ncbi:Adventurous gliding motility protein S [Burkholderiales bacterium]|nr:Adventurous gliding motility protein S [Burkholderiales bacterium]